ncbi:bile acid:sodium symporter family protein [Rhizobium rosettiformans]|uniref:bile acid:sodium symporter family protein n=1 Tax=Rhizobium rosettiformans TaxID=1368430 RepID=UPI0028644A9F|nr:bile acid:sodium symporter [Rhizobium rosettiformans]MDR7029529.1 BASS family bile acid:Na+ symporter [Rhizobium rosettiformans]MDR7063243.1 BASS family bile acid:Na+ symporter [Rhizobium rosettiformans]
MLTELETTLLGIMMMVIMLGMGASMTWRDFFIAFRKPKGILVGLFSQYLIMPFLGYALALALGLPAGMAAGLILIACMPGGTTSNIFAYFSKGVLALSIMMTTVSTLVAVVTVPFLLSFYSGLAGLGGDYVIPAGNVAQVLVVLLVPTVLGMFLRKMNANAGATIEMIGSLLGVVVILFLIGSWVPRNYQMLLDTPFPVYVAAIGIGLTGMLLGYWLARALRQDANRSRTISLETGIQNGPLAALIVTLSFTGTQQQEVLFIPILYSLFIVITSSVITLWYRRTATEEALARDTAKVRA